MKKRVLCFGDSNTWGSCPLDGNPTRRHADDVRWTGVLQRELGSGYTVIEEGQNGRTTVWDDPVEGRMSGVSYLYPCMDSHSPLDLVIIMLGTNDLKTRFGANGAFTIASGLERLVSTVRTSHTYGDIPEILIAAPIAVDPAYKNNPDLYDILGDDAAERSQSFAKAYEAQAKALGCHFIDAGKYGRPSKTDGIHMEAESHEALGKAFAAAVRSIIG